MTDITSLNVKALTNVDVDEATIEQARGVIELATSVDLSDLDSYAARNRLWLSRAIAYQAAWMPSQPDLFSRTDITSLTQDGSAFTTRDANTLLLAPLAQKALSRVSWLRSRTIRVRPGRQSFLGGSTPVYGTLRDLDEGPGWTTVT